VVQIPYPPPTGPEPIPVVTSIPSTQRLWRIWNPERYGATAIGFRETGPFARFDHHQPNRPGSPLAPNLGRGILYAGLTFSAAVIETFGSNNPARIVDLSAPYHLGLASLKRDLVMLDLRMDGAVLAGTVHALCGTEDRAMSQAWGRYFYESPTVYGRVDGILFPSAHNGEDCVALFERAADALTCSPQDVLLLADIAVRAALEEIAVRFRLVVIRG
jgi:RES domain